MQGLLVISEQSLPVLGLEAGIQTCQEWMVCCQGKDSLFCHCALDIIILYDDIFFQHLNITSGLEDQSYFFCSFIHLNSKHFICVALLSQHHLSKRSLSENFQKSKKKLIN